MSRGDAKAAIEARIASLRADCQPSSTHRSHPRRFGRSAVALGCGPPLALACRASGGHFLASSSQFACVIRAGGGVALFPLTRWLAFVSLLATPLGALAPPISLPPESETNHDSTEG
jgi:hypothetical protein